LCVWRGSGGRRGKRRRENHRSIWNKPERQHLKLPHECPKTRKPNQEGNGDFTSDAGKIPKKKDRPGQRSRKKNYCDEARAKKKRRNSKSGKKVSENEKETENDKKPKQKYPKRATGETDKLI